MTPNEWFWVSGLFLTGLTLMAIGMLLGPIGRSARRAELPPTEVSNAEAHIQQTAAAMPNPIVAPAGTTAAVANPATTPVVAPGRGNGNTASPRLAGG